MGFTTESQSLVLVRQQDKDEESYPEIVQYVKRSRQITSLRDLAPLAIETVGRDVFRWFKLSKSSHCEDPMSCNAREGSKEL